jgi:WD40 repeat protein
MRKRWQKFTPLLALTALAGVMTASPPILSSPPAIAQEAEELRLEWDIDGVDPESLRPPGVFPFISDDASVLLAYVVEFEPSFRLSGPITVVDLVTRTIRGTIETSGLIPDSVRFSADNTRAYLVASGFAEELDLVNLESTAGFQFGAVSDFGDTPLFAVSPNADTFASVSGPFYDFTTDERKSFLSLTGTNSAVTTEFAGSGNFLWAEFSPDGSLLVVTSVLLDQIQLWVFDAATGSQLSTALLDARRAENDFQAPINGFSADSALYFTHSISRSDFTTEIYAVVLATGEDIVLDATEAIRDIVPGMYDTTINYFEAQPGLNGETLLTFNQAILRVDVAEQTVTPFAALSGYGQYQVASGSLVNVLTFQDGASISMVVQWAEGVAGGGGMFPFETDNPLVRVLPGAELAGFHSNGKVVSSPQNRLVTNVLSSLETSNTLDLYRLLRPTVNPDRYFFVTNESAFVRDQTNYIMATVNEYQPGEGTDELFRVVVMTDDAEPVATAEFRQRTSAKPTVDGSLIVISDGERIWEWDWLAGEPTLLVTLPPWVNETSGYVDFELDGPPRISADDSLLIVGDRYTVLAIDRGTGKIVDAVVSSESYTSEFFFQSNGIYRGDELVAFTLTKVPLQVSSTEVIERRQTGGDPYLLFENPAWIEVTMNASGTTLYALTETELFQIDIDSFEIVNTLPLNVLDTENYRAKVALSPDENFLLISTQDFTGESNLFVVDLVLAWSPVSDSEAEISNDAVAGFEHTGGGNTSLLAGTIIGLATALAFAIWARTPLARRDRNMPAGSVS